MTELRPMIRRLLPATLWCSALSGAVLVWRGRRDTGSGAAAVNAVSHWVWGDRALHQDAVTARETALGVAIHTASAALWAGLYACLRSSRRQPTLTTAATDAALVSTLAAVVDLKLVPHRLTPGFQERLSHRSLLLTYAAFGIGLAISGAAQRRK